MSKTTTISYYTTPQGIFYKISGGEWVASRYLINGQELEKAEIGKWFFLRGATSIDKFEEKQPKASITKGYKLRDPDFESDKIPAYLTHEQVAERYSGGEIYWENYDNIRSLYVEDIQEQPEAIIPSPFKLDCLGDIRVEGLLSEPRNMTYKVYRDGTWTHKGDIELDLRYIATWDEIDKLLVPDFALKDRPCKLTSKQTYDIIRHYVNTHINPAHAVVSSDYDFCFNVRKKIAIQPYVRRTEITKSNGKSYARPRFNTQKVEHITKDVFDMTHSEAKYKGYPVIKGFEGTTLEDLAENIKLFLDELMEVINQPVEQCPSCKGVGHIYKTADCNSGR